MKEFYKKEFYDELDDGMNTKPVSIVFYESADEALREMINFSLTCDGDELLCAGAPTNDDIHITATTAVVYTYDIGCYKRVCVGVSGGSYGKKSST